MVYVILVVIVTKVSSLCFYFLLIWIQMFSVAYTSYGKLSALYFSSSEVGPLFPKTRVDRNTSALGKTRDSLMDVDFGTVTRIVSLASLVSLPLLYHAL